MRPAENQVLDCDFCHRPMTFEEYRSHHCDGLGGRNPLEEKLRGVKWKVPAGIRAKGTVVQPNDYGGEVTPEAVFNPEAKLKRRARRLAVVGMVLWFGMGMGAGALLG